MLFPTISIAVVTIATISLLLIANWLVWGLSYRGQNQGVMPLDGDQMLAVHGMARANSAKLTDDHNDGGFRRVA